MKKMRKISTVLLALIVALAMSAAAFGETGGVSEDAAVKKALKDANTSASKVKNLEVELDDNGKAYEIEFVKKSSRTEYSYEIAVSDGLILEKSVDYVYKHNKSKKKIGKKKARKIVAKKSGVSLKTIKKGTCKYKYKHKEGKYTLKFRTSKYKYEYELLAPNGKVMEYDYEFIGTR